MIIFKPSQLLDTIKPLVPSAPGIVEAGAFNGSDTLRMIKYWPQATIHAFEPIPYRYEQLVQTTKPYQTIHCYPYALDDHSGTELLYIAEQPDRPGRPGQASSLRKPKERLQHSPIQFPTTQLVHTITLDEWARQHHITHVDLLWLDMQGHELNALKAATTLLQTVKVVYTEVGFIEAYEGQPLYPEVVDWITQHGFMHIGQDFTNTFDHFFGNVLFARR